MSVWANIRDSFIIGALGVAGACVVNLAHGMAGFPPEDMSCAEEVFPNPSTQYIHCAFPPHISKFVSTDDLVAFPAGLLVPKYPAKKVPIVAHFDGYNPRPFGQCDNNGFSNPAAIVTKNCPEPNDGTQLDWGGYYHGENAYGWRIAATVKYATDHYNAIVDWGAGITLQGCSYGGTTSILQSMLMPDPWTKALITVVDACVPNTLMVKQSAPIGMYWKNKAVRDAWGAADWTQADLRTQATGRVYYKIVGSPVDNLVVFDTAFFSDVCDAKRIPCFGVWHNCGHAQSCSGINLPWFDTYTDTNMHQRLDQPQIAFTNSSANSPLDAPIGHYNLGLAWRDGMVNNKTMAIIPLRYLQHTGIGGGVPDQPPVVTFDVTVRNLALNPKAGDTLRWYFGGQSGTATAEAGEVTITGLTLPSSSQYTLAEITQ